MKTYGKVTGTVAALVAIAVSGIALADHNPGHSKKKEKDPTGKPVSKFSIKLENLCVPDEAGNRLIVKSTITNGTSGISDPVQVSEIHVQGLQLVPNPENPKKKLWDTVGVVDNNPNPGISIDPGAFTIYEASIDLCASDALRDDAKALNAQVQVIVDGRNYVANCDDPDPDDGINQAKISLEDYPGLQCPSL
jgi:hypothetical protein